MGISASSQTRGRDIGGINGLSTVKIIHVDGKLQVFRKAISARDVLKQNPNHFLCNMESLNIDSYIQKVAETEELQPDQIFFLLPLSKSHIFLSLPDLCNLAIRANIALRNREAAPTFPARSSSYCKFPAGNNDIHHQVGSSSSSSQLGRGTDDEILNRTNST